MSGPCDPSTLCLHLPLLLVCACATAEDTTTRDIAVSIEDASFVEDGVHPSYFKDGWAVTFSRFMVSIGDVTLNGSSLEDGSQSYRIVDVVRASDESALVLGSALRTSEHPHALVGTLGFTVASAVDPVAGNVDDADIERMRTGQYAVYVEGTAQRGDEIKQFSWGLTTGNTYARCVSTASFADEEPRAKIGVRGDRLFADGELVFDPFAAADANNDGEISEEELRGAEATLGGVDLWTWLEGQTGALVLVDGSQCPAKPS